MGYMHIDNLYKNQLVMLFKRVYAMEKIHGTSAHIAYKVLENGGNLAFFPGGEKYDNFLKCFDLDRLRNAIADRGQSLTIFGEAYGGRCQGMKETYGDKLKFVAFDVKIGDSWLAVPTAHAICESLGIEFVDYTEVEATVEALNIERDKPSTQAIRNGCGNDKKREGIVIRPTIEVTMNNGGRIIAKHKRDDFQERKTAQGVADPAKLRVLEEAKAIAEEWVTPMRLTHVLDKLPQPHDMSITGLVVKAMIEDVYREAKGEIVESKDAERAIGTKAATLFKKSLQERLTNV